ncbi:fimbrillin family protein [Segatella paludivivens]|uniref:fimbrillin family protein n=1 Tax=Segatella paludivivens TaxID=185294 RepID=UPI000A782C8A|nr:fimbrillin family protein [Segatella paludivivens]
MKRKLLNAGLLVCALLITLSGCSSDETLTGDSSTAAKSMKINVSDGMFSSVDNNGVKTRATDDVTGTTFSSGDAIGIFAVKSDGTLALTNAKYIYEDSKWISSNNTSILPYYAGAKYFAYYPYQQVLQAISMMQQKQQPRHSLPH